MTDGRGPGSATLAPSFVEPDQQAGHRSLAPGQVHGAASSGGPGKSDDIIVAVSGYG
jgi:hypothetical protein